MLGSHAREERTVKLMSRKHADVWRRPYESGTFGSKDSQEWNAQEAQAACESEFSGAPVVTTVRSKLVRHNNDSKHEFKETEEGEDGESRDAKACKSWHEQRGPAWRIFDGRALFSGIQGSKVFE